MTDTQITSLVELRKLKELLARGDQRELAKRLEVYPAKIADAFDGFVLNEEFLSRLQAETQKLLTEKGIEIPE
jgi:hypothetical protein